VDTDRVSGAAAELYAADPDEFTGRRKALAAAARDAGDKDAAKRIGALRKPTRPAWVVNRLARADPGAADRLTGLAHRLRKAARAKDGRKLRELSARRDELIDDLTGRAFAAAEISDPPAGLREDVAGTLTAAFADPEIAGQFAAGTLTRATQWAGFGLLPADDPAADSADEDAADEAAAAAHEAEPTHEADEAAARRRSAYEDAERSLAAAVKAAAAAGSAEDELEAAVRDLEERVTKARAELADARLRARRAEAAERKARQALDRAPAQGEP
jgi:hypothetical protein